MKAWAKKFVLFFSFTHAKIMFCFFMDMDSFKRYHTIVIDRTFGSAELFGRTYTVRFGPNDRTFFCRTQNFFHGNLSYYLKLKCAFIIIKIKRKWLSTWSTILSCFSTTCFIQSRPVMKMYLPFPYFCGFHIIFHLVTVHVL